MKAKSSTPAPTPGAYCQRLSAQSLVFPCKPSLPSGEIRRHAEHHRGHSPAAGSEVHLVWPRKKYLRRRKSAPASFPCRAGVIRRTAQGIIAGQCCLEQYARGWRSKLELGWDARSIGLDGEVVGLDRFGASVPQAVLYREFGIPAEAVADTARRVPFRAKGIATQHSWEQPKHSASN